MTLRDKAGTECVDMDLTCEDAAGVPLMSFGLVGITLGGSLGEVETGDCSGLESDGIIISSQDYRSETKPVKGTVRNWPRPQHPPNCQSTPKSKGPGRQGLRASTKTSRTLSIESTPDKVLNNSPTSSETSDFCEYTGFTSDGSSSLCGDDWSSGDMSLDMGLAARSRQGSSIFSCASSCSEHFPLPLVLFCNDCKEPVCLKCKLTDHVEHKATTLINAATERRVKLKALHKNLKCQATNLSSSLSDYERYKKSLASDKKALNERLDKRETYLHRLVDRWRNKVQLQVDAVFSYEMATANAQIEDISQRLSEMTEDIEHLSQVLNHNQARDIITLSQDFLKSEDTEELTVSPLEELYFLFNPGNPLSCSDMGGFTASRQKNSAGLHTLSSGKLLFSFDSRSGIQSQYSATGLSLTAEGNLLVTDLGLDRVQLFRPNGQTLMSVETLPADEPSAAVALSNSDIVVSSRYGLKLYDRNGKFGQKLKHSVECPNGLHVNSAGELIVTDHAHDGPFIHVFDCDCWTVKNTIIGGKRAPNFHEPWYVTTDDSGQIITSDRVEHNIKVFSARGVLRFEFGRQGAQAGCFFRPAGVCVDRFGHILVADSGNNRIQMFTAQGDFCAVLLAENEHELFAPMDLVVDEQDKLVVLQSDGIIGTYQYIF